MAFNNVTTSLDEHIRLSNVDSDWTATHFATIPVEILCSSLAKLVVLDRMLEFAVPQRGSLRKRWVWGKRVVIAVVSLGCATMLAANIAAAVHYQKSADAYRRALLYGASGDTKKYDEYYALAVKEDVVVINAYPVQMICEVAVLLFCLVAFVFAGVMCVSRLRIALLAIDEISKRSRVPSPELEGAAVQAKRLHHKIVCTTVLVFVAFLVRSVASAIIALAFALRDYGKTCPGVTNDCDAACYNVHTLITVWYGSTPEFKPTIVLISSPIALLAVLFGMTTGMTTESIRQQSPQDEVPLQTIARDGTI